MSRPRLGLALRQLRALLRPPRTLHVTTSGRVCLVVTLGVGLAALNTGNNLLYLVVGLLLSAIVVSGVLSERCLRHLRVRRLGASAAFADEPFGFRWAISRARGSSFALQLSEADTDLSGFGKAGYLRAGSEQVVHARLTAKSRGPRHLTGIRVSTSFPFGLFVKSRVFPIPSLLLVYPARERNASPPPAPSHHDPIGESRNPRRSGGTGDLIDLRDLRAGEDGRRIHWVKSAGAGRLLCAERERDERNTVTLSVDANLPGARLESHCVEVASMAHQLLHHGYEVGLDTQGGCLRPGSGASHERRILDALAWVGFEESR